MKKILYLSIVTCCFQFQAFSQAFGWAHQIAGAYNDEGYKVVIDKHGDVYAAGYFFGEDVDFDPGPGVYNLSNIGGLNLYLRKTNSKGELIWVKQIGGIDAVYPQGLVLDKEGDLYLSGYFYNTIDFDPGPDTAILHSAGAYNGFVLKLNSNGEFKWVKQLQSPQTSRAYDLAVSATGSIYVVGLFQGSLDCDPGPDEFLLTTYSPWNYAASFIVKLDPSGNFIWGKQVGSYYQIVMNTVALDKEGGLFTCGTFYGEIDFDPGPAQTKKVPDLYEDAFLQKLDTNGNFIWVKQFGGPSHDYGYTLAIDQANNVFLGGSFEKTVDFNPNQGVYKLTASGAAGGYPAGYIVKLNNEGEFLWAKSISGTNADYIYTLTTDNAGNVYAGGMFTEIADLDPGNGTFYLTSPKTTVFILKLDFLGNFNWVRHVEGASWAYNVAADAKGSVYATGSFSEKSNMNPGTTNAVFTPKGPRDAFILKLAQEWDFKGTVYYDLNKNGIRDSLETAVGGAIIQAKQANRYATSDALGKYHFYDNIQGDTLQVSFPWAGWETVPLYSKIDSVNGTVNFAAQGPSVKDISIALVETQPFRRGFITPLLLQFRNDGNLPVSDIPVTMTIVDPAPPKVFDVITVTPQPMAQTNTQLKWVLNSLQPGETKIIRVNLQTPSNFTFGEHITITAVAILDDDDFPSNNHSKIQAITVGSFDPNDKTVTPAVTPPEQVDTTDLRYVIRFQNTGNYRADFIVIRDTMPSELDLGTLTVLAASHPYTWRMYGNRVLEFRFDNINLPDSTANEPESHGFIAFTINAKKGLPLGANIPNRAGIYFDYNEPVITNTSVMKVGYLVHTLEPGDLNWVNFELSPNPVPAYTRVMVTLPEVINTETFVSVKDALGRDIQNLTVEKGETLVPLNGLPAGSYFVQVRAGGKTGGKVLLVE